MCNLVHLIKKINKFNDFLIKIFLKFHLYFIVILIRKLKHFLVKKYLIKDIKNIIISYKARPAFLSHSDSMPIWVCWFQGVDSMPVLVKKCYESILKYTGNRKVNFIDDKNISTYIKLPEIIEKKYKTGKITKTHLTDILRMGLISQNSGMYMDCTLFLTKKIPDYYFTVNIFPGLKHPEEKKWLYHHIENGRWTEYFIASCNKGSKLFSFVYDCLIKYWENNDEMIDYFLVDYYIDFAYSFFADVKSEIDSFPKNNFHNTALRNCLNDTFDELKWKDICSDTFVNKLNWRIKKNENIKHSFWNELFD